jgi:hypothetical protein
MRGKAIHAPATFNVRSSALCTGGATRDAWTKIATFPEAGTS